VIKAASEREEEGNGVGSQVLVYTEREEDSLNSL
jgi:hypothetical protein